jgi:hypothetical protein
MGVPFGAERLPVKDCFNILHLSKVEEIGPGREAAKTEAVRHRQVDGKS